MKGYGGADGTFICAGTLRGDSQYGPGQSTMQQKYLFHSLNQEIWIGQITLGDILEILPFEDPMVVLEVDGQTIWDAMESALETWPAQEGYCSLIITHRFPF
jgi:5'-nucleotidase